MPEPAAVSSLVEQAAQQYERDPEPQVPDGLPAVRRPPDIEVAPAADLDAWANQVRDAVMEVDASAETSRMRGKRDSKS